MATFRYAAKTLAGEKTTGLIEAESKKSALDALAKAGCYPWSVEELDAKYSLPFFRKIPAKPLAIFTRQLGDLLDAGLSLPKALGIALGQTEHQRLKSVVSLVKDDVMTGHSLSEALRKHPRIFTPLLVSLVQAGEAGGSLSLTLQRAADFFEQEDEFLSKIKTAMAYPLLVALVGAGTILFLIAFVVPKLGDMFVDMGQEMPFITRALLAVSRFTVGYGGLGLAALAAAGAASLAYFQDKKPFRALREIPGRLPLWGPVINKSHTARLTKTLATLLSNGVPILDALRIVARVMEGNIYEKALVRAADRVRGGLSLAEALRGQKVFPEFLCNMIGVGEEANTLEKSLNKIAFNYERDTDRAVKLFTTLLEPLLILAVGAVIGAIVIAMLLPIFQIPALVK